MDTKNLPDFDALWDYGNPAETEAAFRKILAEVGPFAPEGYVIELMTQIARTQGLQRKFKEAHDTLDEVGPRAIGAGGRCLVRYYLERGRVRNSSGDKKGAGEEFAPAWELGKEIGEDGYAVDAAHMVAIVVSGDEALRWNHKALDLASTSTMPSARKWRKSLHNNIGWTYFGMGDFDTAKLQFEKSRECGEENGDAEAERIARWCIAKTLRVQGHVEDALEMQLAQKAELEKDGREGGFVFEELAECLNALGRIEEAKPYFVKAFEALSQDPWIAEGEPDRIERLKDLAGAELP